MVAREFRSGARRRSRLLQLSRSRRRAAALRQETPGASPAPPCAAAAQPAPVATTPPGPARVIPLTAQAPGTTLLAPGQPAAPTQVAALPQAASPKSEYEEAVGLMKQGQYEAAEKGFADFVAKNPK